MPADPTDLLATTLRRTRAVVDAIAPTQASLRTPCPDWTVRDLVGHLLVALRPEYRGSAFGAEHAVPADAPSWERLVAFSGRDPAWTAPA